MGTPRRRSILSNIGTTLNTISVANGYKTNVATVEAVGKSWGDMGTGEKPWVGYAPGRETLEYFPFNDIKVALSVTLICHISASTQAARSSQLNDLLDDVIAVLSVDTTRGGAAISTTVNTVETDEGSPDANGYGSMLITLTVSYLRTTSSS